MNENSSSMENEFNKSHFDNYKGLTTEKESEYWTNAIFVFDSSALIDFYFIPVESRKKIYEEIFVKLQGRLWIPFHVQYEYLKNREKTIKKPISSYKLLKDSVSEIEKTVQSKIDKQIQNIVDSSITEDRHPHIAQDGIEQFKGEIEVFKEKFEAFKRDINSKISDEEKKIEEVVENDDLIEALETSFKVGDEFKYEEILRIIEEGETRFEYKIPPGYGDLINGEKKGIQIFGDLIIWKEIINYAKDKKSPIIFISNDNGKDEDWCYFDSERKRVIAPREELVKEIKDEAGADFWMYNLPQFLYHANEQLQSTIGSEVIEGAEEIITLKLGKAVTEKQWDEIRELAKSDIDECNNKIEEYVHRNSTLGDIMKLEALKKEFPDIKYPAHVSEFLGVVSKQLKNISMFNELNEKFKHNFKLKELDIPLQWKNKYNID